MHFLRMEIADHRTWWAIDEARAILRAEMARRGIGFKRLLSILEATSGEPELTCQSLVNNINCGKFSLAFMLRVCRANDPTCLLLTAVSRNFARCRC